MKAAQAACVADMSIYSIRMLAAANCGTTAVLLQDIHLKFIYATKDQEGEMLHLAPENHSLSLFSEKSISGWCDWLAVF